MYKHCPSILNKIKMLQQKNESLTVDECLKIIQMSSNFTNTENYEKNDDFEKTLQKMIQKMIAFMDDQQQRNRQSQNHTESLYEKITKLEKEIQLLKQDQ